MRKSSLRLNTYTVSFFGHRAIEDPLLIELRLETLIRKFLKEREYVEFLVGKDGEFDQIVSSTIRRCKRAVRDDNSTHVCHIQQQTSGTMRMPTGIITMKLKYAAPPLTVISKVLIKQETEQWLTVPIWLCFVSSTKAVVLGKQ